MTESGLMPRGGKEQRAEHSSAYPLDGGALAIVAGIAAVLFGMQDRELKSETR
jgi:hypothetical protein